MLLVTDTTPFPGAKTCYDRAYRLLRWMGERGGYVQITRRAGKPIRCHVSDEMTILVQALNRGDQETIKLYLLDPRYFNIIHASPTAE